MAKDGKMFLVKRNVEPFKGCWHLIGGHVFDSETLKDALKREFREETNLDVQIGETIGYRIEHTNDRIKIIFVLKVEHATGEIRLNHESTDFGWFAKTPVDSVCNFDEFLNIVF